ncbi:uncharacterized protein [Arachis hypogaea]|uniref:uncharacterized protein n=1 Tax=Arachis hypogaea TaxID=3818 RepID=UPI003B21A231
MKSPGYVKDVQRLAGRLTALSRFLGASAAKALPFFNLMRKGIAFEWTPACEEAFNHFKEILAALPVLGKPKVGEPLYLYLAIMEEALTAVLTKAILPRPPDRRENRPVNPSNTRNGRVPSGSNRDPTEEAGIRWRFHVDRASNQTSGGAGIILENPAVVIYEQSTKFEFPVSNNQAEYETLLGGLTLAREVGVTRLEVCSDSQVVISQVNGSYQARDSLLQKYLEKVRGLCKQFEEVTIQHVPRERNTRADLLSKQACMKSGVGNRSLIQGMVKELAVALHLTKLSPSWLDPIIDFLESGSHPDDEKAAKVLRSEVITRFGIPEVVISDNGTQFTDKKFIKFLNGLGIKQKFSSVEHPQTNGQVESTNKVILLGLKKRLDNKKGALADKLALVLWSYRTTEQSSMGETPFRLTYGVDAMIPVEIGEPSPRFLLKGVEEAVEKDLVDEAREMAHLTEVALKQRMALRYNAKVLRREFGKKELVLRHNDIGLPTQGEGKLATNWEGPYRVKEVLGKAAYKLEKLDGKEIPRTWNASNLRRFYS